MTRWMGLVCLLAACTGTGHTPATVQQLGVVSNSPIFRLVFDADGAPVIASDGFYRFDGTSWVSLPLQGLTGTVQPEIRYDADGTAWAFAPNVSIFKLPRGASQWTAVDTTGFAFGGLPVFASDGTKYVPAVGSPVVATVRVFFQRPGETTWTDTGFDLDGDFELAVPDSAGNLWWGTKPGGNNDDGVQRLKEQDHQSFQAVWSAGAMLGDVHQLVGVAGTTLYGTSTNYASSYGEVYAWDTASHARSTISDGTKCDSVGGYVCDYASGAFIYQQLRAPDGTFYQRFAHQNGDNAAIMELDGDTWWPLIDEADPFVQIGVGPDSQLYVFGDFGAGEFVGRVVK